MRRHIHALWSTLTRSPLDAVPPDSTSIALPSAYVVPGGRFREMYYGDSYFTMLGLKADRRDELVGTTISSASSTGSG